MAVSRALRFQILRRDNHTCRYCGRSAPEVKLTVDHVNPEALGGTNDPTNLVTACADCNGGKSAIPPDAALVAQVDEDAVRWARARHVAAQRALEDFETRQAVRDQFEQHWNRWAIGGQPLDLPAGWEQTVDRFGSAGLPVPILLDCIDVAMARKVRAENVFNYVCGVAWNRLREIEQEAAAALSGGAEESPKDSLNHSQLANNLLNLIGEHLGDEYFGRFLDPLAEAGNLPVVEIGAEAVHRSVQQLITDLEELQGVEAEAAGLYILLDPDFQDNVDASESQSVQLASAIIREAERQLALRYLDSLSDEQQVCWLNCAQSFGREPGWPSIVFAAKWSRRYERNSETPARVCGLPAGEGLICPEPTAFKLTIDACRTCSEGCKGHELCNEHATAAVDGKFAGPDGAHISISAMSEIDQQNDPWR